MCQLRNLRSVGEIGEDACGFVVQVRLRPVIDVNSYIRSKNYSVM